MADRVVCMCNFVTESEILSVLKKGARSTEDIQMYTRAGTSCGRCLVNVDRIVKDYLDSKAPDLQQTIDFK